MGQNSLNNALHLLAPYLLRVTDVGSVFIAALLAYSLRFDSFNLQDQYWFIALVGALLVLIVYSYQTAYGSSRGQYGFSLLAKLIFGWVAAGSIIVGLLVFTRASVEYSRIWLGSWWLLVLGFGVTSRVTIYVILGYMRSIGVNQLGIFVGIDQYALKTENLQGTFLASN